MSLELGLEIMKATRMGPRSMEQLRAELAASENTLRTHLLTLLEHGVLCREPGMPAKTGPAPHVYRLSPKWRDES